MATTAERTERCMEAIARTVNRSAESVRGVIQNFVQAVDRIQRADYALRFYLTVSDLEHINRMAARAKLYMDDLRVTEGYLLHLTLTLYSLVYLIDRNDVDLVRIAREIGIPECYLGYFEKRMVKMSCLLAKDVLRVV